MDEDQTFFTLGADGYYYNNELVIPKDKFSVSTATRGETAIPSYLAIDTNITDDNIFVERKFREKAEQFLNDFTYKLYKSPTEGNIIIGLMNVSMTPNASLGRMILSSLLPRMRFQRTRSKILMRLALPILEFSLMKYLLKSNLHLVKLVVFIQTVLMGMISTL